MAISVDLAPTFPEGTNVAAYLAKEQVANSTGPLGTAASSATVTGGSATFSGLVEDETYVVFGTGSSARIGFTVNQQPEPVLLNGVEIATKEQLDAITVGEVDLTGIEADLAAEEVARTSADSTLQSSITSEASTRGSADTTLQGNINSEASTRATADSTLTTAVGAAQADVDAHEAATSVHGIDTEQLMGFSSDPAGARTPGVAVMFWSTLTIPTNRLEGDLWMNTGSGVLTTIATDEGPVTPGPVGSNKGFSTDGYFSQLALGTQQAMFDEMVALGAGWVRISASWDQIQPVSAGAFVWSDLDDMVNESVSRGLRPLVTILFTPSWARAVNTGKYWDAPDPTKLATFCSALVARYKAKVKHWEFWNEPNLSSFWYSNSTGGVSVAAYIACLQAIYPVIKFVDANAVVATAGLAPASDSGVSSINPRSWLSAMYLGGAKGYYDAVAMHPYTGVGYPTETQDWNPWFQMTQMRQTMVAQGESAIPMMITESGSATAGTGGSVTEQKQSDQIGQGLNLWQSYSWGGKNGFGMPMFTYTLRDHNSAGATREDHFGVLTDASVEKPSAAAFRAGGQISRGAILDDAPNAYWKMEDASGSPQDTSGNAMHVNTVLGSPTYRATGKVGYAVTLNGTSGGFIVNDTSLNDLGDTFTLEAWIKRASTSRDESIFNKGANGYILHFVAGDNKLYLRQGSVGDVLSSTTSITDTNWHHVAATKDGATSAKIYIDGVDVSGTVTNRTITATTNNLGIGVQFNGLSEFFSGSIDELAIFENPLSAARILAHYQEGPA